MATRVYLIAFDVHHSSGQVDVDILDGIGSELK